jgi:hypothetical protein
VTGAHDAHPRLSDGWLADLVHPRAIPAREAGQEAIWNGQRSGPVRPGERERLLKDVPALVAASRIAQGLPETVSDPATVARIVALLDGLQCAKPSTSGRTQVLKQRPLRWS